MHLTEDRRLQITAQIRAALYHSPYNVVVNLSLNIHGAELRSSNYGAYI